MNLDYKFVEIKEEIEPEDFVIKEIAVMDLSKHPYELYANESKFYGSFMTMDETIKCLIEIIKKESYHPNIFIQDERGWLTQITLIEPIEI